MRRLTQEEFVKKAAERSPMFEIVSTYTKSTDDIVCRCRKCGDYKTIRAAQVIRGTTCPTCVAKSLTKTQEQFEHEVLCAHNGSLRVIGEYQGARKYVGIQCLLCGGTFDAIASEIAHGSGCPYCNSKRILVGFNDLWAVHPEVARLLDDPLDGYRFMGQSGKKARFRCPRCNKLLYKTINNVVNQGLSCACSGRGVSYGERFVAALLAYAEIEYIHDSQTSWSQGCRYDFIIDDRIICEVMGKQHYQDAFVLPGSRSLIEEQENDRFKKEMAVQNGMMYIALDCRESNFQYIQKNIMSSGLLSLLHIDHVDWDYVRQRLADHIDVRLAQRWNSGESVTQIALSEHLSKTTIRTHLHRACDAGLCDYSQVAQ